MKNKKQNGIIYIFKNIFYLFKTFWLYGKAYIITSIILSAITYPLGTVTHIYFQQVIMDALYIGKDFRAIIVTITLFGIIMFFTAIINHIWIILYGEKRYTEIIAKINRNIYEKSISTDYKYFDNPEFYNNYIWTINEYASKVESSRILIVNSITYIITITALIAIIAANDYFIIIFTIITLIVSTQLSILLNKIRYKKAEETIIHDRKRDYVHRIFYIRDWAAGLKSTNVARYLYNKYNDAVKEKVSIIKKYMINICILENGNQLINNILYLSIVAYLSYQILNGKLSIGSFVGMIAASSSLRSYLNNFFNLIKRGQELSIYTDRIKIFFNLESTIELESVNKNYITVPKKPFSIELKNVSFTYDNSHFALKNLNLSINKGEKIAIVGENGSGKTTFTKLLLRLYDPTSGEILINGVSLKDYKIQEIRKSIGIAFQDSPIYALTMAQNMSVYHETTDEDLQNISKMLKLNCILQKSSAGFKSEVTREFDKDGLMLSGGEKQKLALSRLYIGEFGLLILDEPTSSLDPFAEYELNKILFNKSATITTIMISHRLSSICDADRIYLIDNGTIREQGTHEQLMENHGKYYEMFTKQAENYVKNI